MPFGLPCPDDLQPDQVYVGIQQTTDVVTGLVTALEAEIQSAYQQAVAYTGQSVGILQKTLQSQIAALQRLIRGVADAIASALTSGIVSGNVQFSSALQAIAQSLQITPEEVLYGLPQTAAPPLPFVPGAPVAGQTGPVQASPGVRVETGLVPGTIPLPAGLPATQSGTPASEAATPLVGPAPGGQPAPVIIWRDGAPSTLTQICAPVQSTRPVMVDGRVYQPTASVYATGDGITVNADGQPSFTVGYDSQPDGSVVVYAGPISVRLSLPPHPSDPEAPACAIG